MSAHGKDREEEEDEEALSEEEAVRKVEPASTLKNSARPQQVIGHIPEVVDDFLRNFLRRAGLIRTLRVFEAEWTENLQRGPQMRAKSGVSFIPDALTHRQLLRSELDAVCREADALRREGLEAEERTATMLRETDFYRRQCKRAAEEKKELTDNIKQLKKRMESYEPALRQLEEKYKAALRQKILMSLKKDNMAHRQSGQRVDVT